MDAHGSRPTQGRMNPLPHTPIRKAIIPVGALGITVGSASTGGPRNLLTVVDKPIIQYAIEEAIAAGIGELIFVTSPARQQMSGSCDPHDDLEHELQRRQKLDLIELVLQLQAPHLTRVSVRQAPEPGLGPALMCAEELVKKQAFALIVAEDLMHHSPNVLQQMMRRMATYPAHAQPTLLAIERHATGHSLPQDTLAGQRVGDRLLQASSLGPAAPASPGPHQMGIVGRYLLTPAIFEHLDPTRTGHPPCLRRALLSLLRSDVVLAYEYEGTRYDCSSTFGYLQANVELALRAPDLQDRFGRYIEQVVKARAVTATAQL